MNKKDKDLLIKDLSARVFYGVKVNIERDFPNNPQIVERIGCDGEIIVQNILAYDIYYYKPYLRPISSMTEEEKKDLKKEHLKDEKLYAECLTNAANGDSSMRGKVIPHFAADWCNKNHFDYRGLIPMGLALEAPVDIYKTE